ncbi:MAG: Flp pilus assembly complex ATPase component TadA [Phycisphaeraceae bacterium]|nr:MAG: Flp pilus assembly complex ATPase component TadA [Phycisphaeraceae bacterium]
MTSLEQLATTLPAFTLADGFVLVSFWKPILLMLPFIGWAWMVSTIFDKHCARFFLPREPWNTFHLCMGLVAFLVAVLMPIEGAGAFWAGLGAAIVILAADIMIFTAIVNRDDRVPAEHRVKLLDLSSYKAAREAKAAQKKQGKVQLVIKGPDKQVLAAPDSDKPEFATRLAAETMMIAAMGARASELALGPSGKDTSYVAMALVDGVRQPIGNPMTPAEALAVMDFWKSAARLDLAERRKKQQGDVGIERETDRRKLRVATLGTQAGPRMTVLFDPEAQVRRKPTELGLLDTQEAALKELASTTQGIVLLAGQPDGGRTTLLYAALKLHDAYTQNVQTVELDIQDTIEGAKQNKFDPQAEGPEFSTLVRSILRRDPDVVGIAELPDTNTAKEIVKADQERTRTYVSLRADNAVAAVLTWVKIVGSQEEAAKSLRGVVAERLVRKVCINCRVPYQPAPDMLKKLGLPADKVKQLFKKGGQVLVKNKPEICPVCQGSGYIGLEGCFEVFPVGEAERECIRQGNLNGLRAEFRKKGLPTIQQSALRKVVDGLTTVEEMLRATAEPQPPAAAAPGTPPKNPSAPANA